MGTAHLQPAPYSKIRSKLFDLLPKITKTRFQVADLLLLTRHRAIVQMAEETTDSELLQEKPFVSAVKVRGCTVVVTKNAVTALALARRIASDPYEQLQLDLYPHQRQ